MDLAERLAETLQRLREDAGLDQKAFAKRLKMSHATVHRLLRGDRGTTLRTIQDLCTALRCTPNDLFEPGRLKLPSRRSRG